MTETERFLFDCYGFLIVRGFLAHDEVDELNAALDARWDDAIVDDPNAGIGDSPTLAGERPRQTMGGMLTWPEPWCRPFRRLLAHPKLRPYLTELLGPGWRMDHAPQMFIADKGAEGLILHGAGQSAPQGPAFHQYANGHIRCGMISLEYMLAPVGDGDGGFAIVPGSHKANLRPTEEVLRYQAAQDLVLTPTFEAGDLLIFNEAAVHGTMPWRGAHQRRALLYRYSPSWLNWQHATYVTTQAPWVAELDEAERAVLEPPYVYDRPIIGEDGSVNRVRAAGW